MSELKTNKISTNDQNNVAIDNALGLKSYTTAQRDALTSVAGDMIYNSDDAKVQVYSGSAWENLGLATVFQPSYLVVGGGAGGGSNYGGGGGAGGYRTHYSSDRNGGQRDNTPIPLDIVVGKDYTVTVGAGGSANTDGSDSVFGNITSNGGGAGKGLNTAGSDGASGGAGGASNNLVGGNSQEIQGSDAGRGSDSGVGRGSGGGGGGAGGAGGNGSSSANGATGGNAGPGLTSNITGTGVGLAGGGAGGAGVGSSPNNSGNEGGGNGGSSQNGVGPNSGTANTGGGGGGGGAGQTAGAGGSGIVRLRFPTADYTLTIGAGLTSSSATDGSDTVVSFTAGTGTITFS
jgi:hypothetical protein